MSVLILDADSSLSALGSPNEQAELFGVPPVKVTRGFADIKAVLNGLFQQQLIETDHPILGKIKDTITVPSKASVAAGVSALVIDTFSHLVKIQIRTITRDEKTGTLRPMELQDYGTLGRDGEDLLWKLAAIPIPVVVNCHIEFEKDAGTGSFYYVPQIVGSMKFNIQQYFDCVFFTRVRSEKGKQVYFWNTKVDANKFGKDRKNLLAPQIAQDFGPVLDAYREAGIATPKILVIGESGTGKTFALRTLKGR